MAGHTDVYRTAQESVRRRVRLAVPGQLASAWKVSGLTTEGGLFLNTGIYCMAQDPVHRQLRLTVSQRLASAAHDEGQTDSPRQVGDLQTVAPSRNGERGWYLKQYCESC